MRIFRLLTLMLACGHVFSGKIFGGQDAKAHSRPYMVLVNVTLPDNTINYCAGFLLDEWFVMTAAHCQGISYTVQLGRHDISRKEKDVQKISVDRAFPDTEYNKKTHINDIMLLKLKHKAKLGQTVKTIPLADPNDQPPQKCMVFGWGRFTPNSTALSPVLKEANVTLSKSSDCEKDYYCSKGQSGPGEGDSGCPLVCENGKVYGVMSMGSNATENGERKYWYTMTSKDLPLVS